MEWRRQDKSSKVEKINKIHQILTTTMTKIEKNNIFPGDEEGPLVLLCSELFPFLWP